jgi:hypothetical protein
MAKGEIVEATEEVSPEKRQATVPVGFVPAPTAEYRAHRKLIKATTALGAPPIPSPIPIPIPIPIPLLVGPRVLMWKQDPSVAEIGIRKAFLPRPVSTGPADSRIKVAIVGMTPVSPNAMGDFIQTPLTPQFDAVHTFAVVRETLTMYQRALAVGGTPAVVPWQWNTPTVADPIQVFPRHSVMQNAFYSRSGRLLAFGQFPKPGAPAPAPTIFTCRSLDIVAHETGHAVLDGLKPNWLLAGNPPQTGALHEAFGDLTAIFLALSQFDQVEAVIAQTKANLHNKTFLADLAEEFGLALGLPMGLRNADNNLRLSDVSNEVHALSQVFTGALYDILADIFAFERRPALRDDAITLQSTAQYLMGLLLRAIQAAPASAATFANVANQMLIIANADGKPAAYRNFIRNRFTVRQVVVSPTPLTEDHQLSHTLEAVAHVADSMPQNREACCGTMTLPEHNGVDESIQQEQREFLQQLSGELQDRAKKTKAESR